MVYWVSELSEKGLETFLGLVRASLENNYSCSNEVIENYLSDSVHDKLGNFDAHLTFEQMEHVSHI